ncbi:MAG: hypothetical protein HY548_04650 [Elusimicrobia bacterium]|nr:hypothetical protein [Elusimicrobiota bacterium]
MKNIFSLFFVLAACLFVSVGAEAAGLVSPLTNIDSTYVMSQSTISVSSDTVTTISPGGRYREVYLGDPDITTSVFYRVDGSTVNVPTVGLWFSPATVGSIESSATIYLQLPAGASSITLRKLEVKK